MERKIEGPNGRHPNKGAEPVATHEQFDHRPAGTVSLHVEVVAGKSTVVQAFATSPMKLLMPRARYDAVWAYTSSFGGGMVAGDETRLEVSVGSRARLLIGTQASTKIYRSLPRGGCSHRTKAMVGPDAFLVLVPDPIQPFAGSIYSQKQEFHLAGRSSLVFLDWITSGRAARGERWAFSRVWNRTDIFIDGERVFLDALRLDSEDPSFGSPHTVGRFNCFATLLILGPLVLESALAWLADVANQPIGLRPQLLCGASRLRDGAVIRLAGESVEAVAREIQSRLSWLERFLGDDPWSRKW